MLDEMQIETDENEPGIVATGLVKEYPGVRAVQGIDLYVPRGSIIGLLGPNGAGKTTTLRMLAGIMKPTAGDIRICGIDILHSVAAKGKIGFLSGDTQLYERLTVREILRFFGRLHRMPADQLETRIDQLVSDMEMSSYADRRVGTLSSGQGQRANIARTMIHDPEVLILDEATASLDIISCQFIIETLKRLRSAGKAILFSTHIMSEAEYLCDRISLIHGGRVIDAGTNAELLERNQAANLTEAFLARIAAVEAES
jgi:sodium transport system ATP-binding protein